ncbi:beta-glucosidase [Striga asiatica]|uniref:Beta-glucosidase n=1 Tax=Striga asiatica TaxID=4170 RepID=A0A5A7PS96_STRAF|nr:beta-glucosidase [Striga asiatica]
MGSDVPSLPIDPKISRQDFPKDFVFGCATSAYQVEGAFAQGGRAFSTWDVFSNGYPGNILDGSNGNVAVDMYNRYKEDIKTMKIMGFDAYRFSISWSRILPGGKVSLGVNQEGIDYYNDLINTVIDNGMKPYVTLFHWDLPYLLEKEYGGFLSHKIVDDFRDFADLCFWEFGDRVKHWITINEAWTYSASGYASRHFPPGRHGYFGPENEPKSTGTDIFALEEDEGQNFIPYRGARVAQETRVEIDDFSFTLRKLVAPPKDDEDVEKAREAYTVGRNILLSHAAAVETYRKHFQELQKGKIGITNCIHWFEPFDETKDEDVKAARRAFDFMLGWFMEPVLTGQYPKNMLDFAPREYLEPFNEEESKLLKGSVDFVGINFYTAMYAQYDPNSDANEGYYKDQKIKFKYVKNGLPIGDSTGSSWLYVVPWAFWKLLKFLKDTYDNPTYKLPPIYITENGCDQQNDPQQTPSQACKDTQRVNYYRDHLAYMQKAIKELNVKVESYFAWSFCDNFEWYDGYRSRFGILYIDFKNDLKRYRKDSAMWWTKFLLKDKEANGDDEGNTKAII